MALIDKIENADGFSAHTFASVLRLWFTGDATRTQAISLLNLAAEDETQLDDIKTSFDGQSGGTAKVEFALKIEAIAILLQEGKITQAQAKTLYGMA